MEVARKVVREGQSANEASLSRLSERKDGEE
jgi:hypothetical protein